MCSVMSSHYPRNEFMEGPLDFEAGLLVFVQSVSGAP